MNLWDFKAGFYDRVRKLFPFNIILEKENANVENLLSKIDFDNGKILDVGAGSATRFAFLGKKAQVFALDNSSKMINKAKYKVSKNLIVADALSLPIKSNSFDMLTAIGLLEYQKEKMPLLEEFQRVVIPAGYLLLTYSQTSLLNFMRFFAGHYLYLLSSDEFVQRLEEIDIRCLENQHSLIQTQVLLQTNA